MHTNYWEDERGDPPSLLARDRDGKTILPSVDQLHAALDRINPNPCQLRLSPRCTRERAYRLRGKYICAHCYTLLEQAIEAVGESVEACPQCEAERMAVEMERRR